MKVTQAERLKFSEFVANQAGDFQQSWQWGEVQEEMGRVVKRLLVVDEGNKVIAVAQLVKHNLPFGKFYWFCPKGPLFMRADHDSDKRSKLDVKGILKSLISYVEENHGGMFLRIEPQYQKLDLTRFGTGQAILVKAPKDHNPRSTILIDLRNSADELLKSMHHKTRYNINLAKKKGVLVSEVEDKQEYFEKFFDLLNKTSSRGKFSLHPKKHYEELIHLPEIRMFIASFNKEIIAGALVSFFNGRAVYLHGASDYRKRQLMAPHLLHWQIILAAKEANLQIYDLGGVAPRTEPEHPLQGVTRFKQGFGGRYVELVGSWDAVFSIFWYELYKIVRTVL